MSFRDATGVALGATLLLTASCGGGSAPPRAAPSSSEIELSRGPGSTLAPGSGTGAAARPNGPAIRFEDLPVTRLDKSRVPRPNGANPSLGAENAPVVIQLWSDFECPYCATVHPVLTELLQSYAGRVRLVWRDYPLPFHAHARLAANAGREAYAEGGAQGFWKFHDAVYESENAELDASGLARLASKAGLDATRFRESLSTLRHNAEVDRDVQIGDTVGVEGTPAFLINDYFFVGAVPIEVLRVVVDRALSDLGS